MVGAVRRFGASVVLVFIGAFVSPGVLAQPATPILTTGDIVVSGFSGTVAADPAASLPQGKLPVDLTFIDVNGSSARITDASDTGAAWDAHVISPDDVLDVPASDVGQVFGIALDDAQFPNVYLAATSAFGLNIVVPGRTRDSMPDRTKLGQPRAVWMQGQFGLDLYGDPGSIWKVDGATGEVSLFANVSLNGVRNPGPSLGGISFDSVHQQLFVSDRYTGMIHRFVLDGTDLGHFDHGTDGRSAAALAVVPFDPNVRMDIASPAFDSEDLSTWTYAPPQRHVWGLAVHDGRLFYAVADGPQIWSIGIESDGSFGNDPRWELDLPAADAALQVSDMTFSNGGALILAARAPATASYDYSAFTLPAEPRVLVYWLENPDDPQTPGRWMQVPEEYAIGFPNGSRNSDGGADLGYAYGPDGLLDAQACEGTLWTTGDELRNDPNLLPSLSTGGPLLLDGLQASPADQVRNANTPPWLSYYVDYDGKFDDDKATGHMGAVRILKAPCVAPLGRYVGPRFVPQSCVGTDCAPPPSTPSACFASKGSFECDQQTGQWVYQLSVSGPAWVNTVTAVSLTPGMSVAGGPIALDPANIPVTGAPGSSAVIEVCAFDAAAALSGKPYDCCRSQVKLTIPTKLCEVKP